MSQTSLVKSLRHLVSKSPPLEKIQPSPKQARVDRNTSYKRNTFHARDRSARAPSLAYAARDSIEIGNKGVPFVEELLDESEIRRMEVTEVSTAAVIRLMHRLLELQEVVVIWKDFKNLRSQGQFSDYLTRCYFGEILSSWRELQRCYNYVRWLRENGDGMRKPTALENEVGKLSARVADWRRTNWPALQCPISPSMASPPHPWPAKRSASGPFISQDNSHLLGRSGSKIASSARTWSLTDRRTASGIIGRDQHSPNHHYHYYQHSSRPPVPPIPAPFQQAANGGSSSSGSETESMSTPALLNHKSSTAYSPKSASHQQQKLNAADLVDTILTALQACKLTRAQMRDEIRTMRADLLEAHCRAMAAAAAAAVAQDKD